MGCDSTNSSSTNAAGFPNSALMQQLATNFPTVWEEICMLQQAILAASSQCQPGGGQMCTTVGGNTPMTFVTGVSSVTVVNGGFGYFIDTPSVVFTPPLGSSGSGATATLVTNGGNILEIVMVTGGSGYQPVPATLSVSSLAGVGANLQLLVDGAGGAAQVNIISGGSGYTVNDTVTATRAVGPNPAYVNAVFKITSVSVTGEIIEVIILNPGSGYQPSVATAKIVSSINPALPYPLGTGFMADVLTNFSGAITGAIITNTGAGYASFPPYMIITDPGTGATTSVNVSSNSISSISVTEPGSNYTQSATGNVLNPPTAGLPNPPTAPAVVTINVSNNTFGTNPQLYWQVWAGTTTNKPIQVQLNQVLSYFTALGYTITIQSNPATGNTIQWKICW